MTGTIGIRTLAACAVMVAAIATAWAFQLVGSFVPCALCLEQREGYYVAIPLAVVALFAAGRRDRLARALLVGAAAAMAWSAALGIYHAGAEWAFWEGPVTCGGGAEVREADNLLATLQETRLVSCTDASGRFVGLSFAGWNVVAASLAALLLLLAALAPRPERDERGRAQ